MDLQKFKFPEPSMCLPTDKKLLLEAQVRGFDRGSNKYNKLFSELFFSGGQLNFKKDLPEDFRNAATKYLKAFMGSFEPKHEHKEAAVAFLLNEWFDDVEYQ